MWIYQDLLNLYGDRGNILTLIYRARARGININVVGASLGEPIPADVGLIFIGGGQDQEQKIVAQDLQAKNVFLRNFIQKGGPLLAICGGYQLLGEYYQISTGTKISGADVLPIYTKAGNQRMIEDLTVKVILENKQHTMIGFENHSGKTFIKKGSPLGQVDRGFGNNGQDKTAGLKYHNVIGTYAHGPLLPKNPFIADFLLNKALEYQGLPSELGQIENKEYNKIIKLARRQALFRAYHRKKEGLGLHS